MRKIPDEFENPFDNFLYLFVEKVEPYFYEWKFTPNMITTLSFITTIVSLMKFHCRQNVLGSIWLVISYFFDCVDGYYARKHNMVTDFGDYYDHFTDLFLSIGLIYELYVQNTKRNFQRKVGIAIFFYLLTLVHFGCQEVAHQGDDTTTSPTLHFTRNLCPRGLSMNYTRYFGSGTLVVVMILLFLF